MNQQKLRRRLQWYQICGTRIDNHLPVITFVEATSRQAVLKYHGGCQKQSAFGNLFFVQFPTDKQNVRALGKYLNIDIERLYAAEPDVIIKVIPITRYRCSCGKEHISEHPYPGVWCSCGQRALPVESTLTDCSA